MVDDTRRVVPDDEVADHVDALFGSGGLFPLDGPYGPGRTEAAAGLLRELARYLNYASQSGDGVPWPSTVGRIVSGVAGALALIEQTFTQSTVRLDALARDPRAYVDQVGEVGGPDLSPTGAALATRAYLAQAAMTLADAGVELRAAARYAGRMGLRDPDDETEAGSDDRH